ncbi:MAG: class I SAM-dependent methyltransferase [Kiritimatiellia bacterium]|nr:class I SAM-dependent methyltransferase [Kiritimatiellia bacterium]
MNNLIQSSKLLIADKWTDYEVLDCGDGRKLERWGKYIFIRPDPQVIWPKVSPELWENYDAIYRRSSSGGGAWNFVRKIPEHWMITYHSFKFKVRPTGFKHLGLFPEQQANWDWIIDVIKGAQRPVSLLNLFGYTGGATVAAASTGAAVCHVDAARGMVDWCRENAALCGLANAKIKYIVDDCLAFIRREIRRGKSYDAIIMDPPSFGRGKSGEIWKLEDNLWELLDECRKLLGKNPLFMLVNAYTANLSPLVLANMVGASLKDRGGRMESGEIGLPVKSDGKILPCGIYCRWQAIKT